MRGSCHNNCYTLSCLLHIILGELTYFVAEVSAWPGVEASFGYAATCSETAWDCSWEKGEVNHLGPA